MPRLVFRGDKLDAFLRACAEVYRQRALTAIRGDSEEYYAERSRAFAAMDKAWEELDCYEGDWLGRRKA